MNGYGMKVAAYSRNDVQTANRLQLLIMLYDGAINFMKHARERLVEKDHAKKGYYITKAMAIISELKSTLDFSANRELAGNLDRLYIFINDCLMKAQVGNDETKIDEAIRVTGILRDGWVELSQNGGQPVEQHAMDANAPGLRVSV
ncbi:flagellar export chaperone FliS [bacterium]|nr:flagellar export chaperone FliS [bacterium]